MRDLIDRAETYQAIMSQEVVDKSVAKRILMQIPSAELIRCKDCKHAEESDEREWLLCHWYGDQWNEESHWCSHAERKEDE